MPLGPKKHLNVSQSIKPKSESILQCPNMLTFPHALGRMTVWSKEYGTVVGLLFILPYLSMLHWLYLSQFPHTKLEASRVPPTLNKYIPLIKFADQSVYLSIASCVTTSEAPTDMVSIGVRSMRSTLSASCCLFSACTRNT